jgi:hypothetical protein
MNSSWIVLNSESELDGGAVEASGTIIWAETEINLVKTRKTLGFWCCPSFLLVVDLCGLYIQEVSYMNRDSLSITVFLLILKAVINLLVGHMLILLQPIFRHTCQWCECSWSSDVTACEIYFILAIVINRMWCYGKGTPRKLETTTSKNCCQTELNMWNWNEQHRLRKQQRNSWKPKKLSAQANWASHSSHSCIAA